MIPSLREVRAGRPRRTLGAMAVQLDSHAVQLLRDGVPTVAHYGSIAGEIAVLRKSAGLVARPNLARFDIHGAAPGVEHALARMLGRDAPAAGQAVCAAGTWCARVEPGRAALIGPAAALSRWRSLLRGAVVAGDRVAVEDAPVAVLSVIGPRAAKVLAAAGLPGELPAGGVAADTLAGLHALVLREDAATFLIVVAGVAGDAARDALLRAGRPLELAPAGADALARLRAASPIHH